MMKILLLGDSGFLGNNLSKELTKIENIDLFTINAREEFKIKLGQLKLSSKASKLIYDSDFVINCIADTSFESCASSKNSFIINAILPRAILDAKNNHGTLIHFSTDAFYNQTLNFSNEKSKLEFSNSYAYQKFIGEELIKNKNSIVLRGSFFGWNHRGSGLINYINNAITQNYAAVDGWSNVYTSALHIRHLTQIIISIIFDKRLEHKFGLYNFGTSSAYSKYSLIKEILPRNIKLKNITFNKESANGISRNLNCGLNPSKLDNAFGLKFQFNEVINECIKDLSRHA